MPSSAVLAPILAIDIGGTKFSLALFVDGKIVRREMRATDRAAGREAMLPRIAGMARSWNTPFGGCGIGFGGPVNFAAKRVAQSTHAPGWSDFDFPAWTSEHLGVDAIIDNDANCGALGEAIYGAGQAHWPLFYMTLSTGNGGGSVTEHGGANHVWRGADSFAGEIGHTTIRPDGPRCLCGARGCLERLCCGLWLERDHGRPASILMQDAAFVERYVVDLAQGLKTVIMLLNPARIVIGGGIAKAGDRLFMPLRRQLGRQMTPWSKARIDVVPAALGDDSVLWGAYALASATLVTR